MSSKTGLFVGLNKGFIVTKPDVKSRKLKPSYRKGRLHPRVKFVREIVREVVGLAPYERKMMELLKADDASKDKKAVKIARARLGTNKRALRKRLDIQEYIKLQRKK